MQKYARALVRPQLTGDSSPVVVEEYMFETERRDGRVNMSRLVIMQRLSDESYLGTLYVDRDFKDSDPKGNACRLVFVAYLLLFLLLLVLISMGTFVCGGCVGPVAGAGCAGVEVPIGYNGILHIHPNNCLFPLNDLPPFNTPIP